MSFLNVAQKALRKVVSNPLVRGVASIHPAGMAAYATLDATGVLKTSNSSSTALVAQQCPCCQRPF